MHYYQFNIGDYQSHTAHLDPLEDIAYRRMLDWCYLHEKPLPTDLAEIARVIRMRGQEAAIQAVLGEFFVLEGSGYWQARIEAEIAHFRDKVDKASRAGKASAERRLNARSTDEQPTNNQEPTPITNNQLIPSSSGTKFPDCPQQEILNLWKKHLPHLTQPRSWEGSRKANLKARWVQAAKPSQYSPEGYKTRADGLAWWDAFLGYIANDTRLATGFEGNGRVWKPDLEWIVNATNFQKIIDGKYNK